MSSGSRFSNCRVGVIVLFAIAAFLAASPRAQAQGRSFNVLTRNYNDQRTGANLSEMVLDTSNVNSSQFGKLYVLPVDDQIFAGILYASAVPIAGGTRNVIYVATSNNSVYAFDADTLGSPLWFRNFNGDGRPTHNTEVGQACGSYKDFSGNIGIVGTPVIDGSTRTMYFVTRTVEGYATVQRLRALDIATGDERENSPRVIEATVAGTGDGTNGSTLDFNPRTQNQRPGLALSEGVVYIGWSSFCDTRPYHGWMMAYDAASLAQTGVFNVSPDGIEGGIWMSGAAPSFDASGNLYLGSGNGSFDAARGLFGESLLKLAPTTLARLDYFTPSNFVDLNNRDWDFGSLGPTMLPGTHRFVTGGKEGKLYLLDIDNLGQISSGDTQIPQSFQAVDPTVRPGASHHLHNASPVWNSPQGLNVYVWGENDFLRAFRFNPSTQKLDLPAVANGAVLPPIGMPGGMMVVSANGSQTRTGILWASIPRAGDANQDMVPGHLFAFDAETLALLWSSTGPGDDTLNFAKGSPPLVANGRVYVASISNFVSVYGLTGASRDLRVVQNLALNHSATGSAPSPPCDPSQTPDQAFNGSAEGGFSDKWCSPASGAFLQVDLGANFSVNRFVLEHAGAGGENFSLNTRDFTIQVSVDGTNWDTVANVLGNTFSITTHDIPPTTARYVRLTVHTATQLASAPSSIYELQVYGSPAPSTPDFQPSSTPGSAASQERRKSQTPAVAPGRSTIPAPADVAAPPPGAQTTASGVAMRVLKPGRGAGHPVGNDCLSLRFTGWERDGALFSTSGPASDPEVHCLTNLIAGVAEALKLMVAGEKRRIWVPANLTFTAGHHHRPPPSKGPDDSEADKPPRADLTFDVELVQILKAPPTPADLKAPPKGAIRTPSGLAFKVLKRGTGDKHPSMTSQVTLHFSGWTRDGRLFESTVMSGRPAIFHVGTVLPGWREGLPHMIVGEKTRFWIPAALAYGEKPVNKVNPAGSLVYDIELLALQ